MDVVVDKIFQKVLNFLSLEKPCLLERYHYKCEYKFSLNPVDSSEINIAKDINIPTKDMNKK